VLPASLQGVFENENRLEASLLYRIAPNAAIFGQKRADYRGKWGLSATGFKPKLAIGGDWGWAMGIQRVSTANG
jgi:hypothetical protein